MRDPNRIDEIVEVLREYWKQHPDYRLAQIVVNACQPSNPCPEVFYTEDDVLLDRLKSNPNGVLDV